MNAERNLDRLAAQAAHAIVGERSRDQAEALDILTTKVLGVLQENGVYACFLFLFSRPDRERALAQDIRTELLKLLAQKPVADLGLAYRGRDAPGPVLTHIADTVCADLDRLLLVRTLYEQTLIYLRHGAKARKEEIASQNRMTKEGS